MMTLSSRAWFGGRMSLTEFLPRLLEHGEARFRQRPSFAQDDRMRTRTLLQQAFEGYRLDVAGSLIEFDSDIALAAAEVVCMACWYLVNREEREEALKQVVQLPGPPRSAAAHLSADLTLRYLTYVHRRSRALDAADVLTTQLAGILRNWPLSGVQSDVEEAPLAPLDFDGHDGLMLLYAERYARRPKVAWQPPDGRLREFIELATLHLETPNAPT
jgi:hypothetical protein